MGRLGGIAFCLSRLLVHSHRAYFEFAPIRRIRCPCFLPGVVCLPASPRPRGHVSGIRLAFGRCSIGAALRPHARPRSRMGDLSADGPRHSAIRADQERPSGSRPAISSRSIHTASTCRTSCRLWLSFTRLAFLPMPLRWAVFVTTVVCVPLTLYQQPRGSADSIRQRARRQLFSDGPLADDRGARPHRHRCQW